jgi:hypothetical protein
MATSIIRKLMSEGTGLVHASLEAGKDSIAPAVTGLAIGALGAKKHMDVGPVPTEALGGYGLRALNEFGLIGKVRSHLPGKLKVLLSRDVVADVSAAAIGAGMARVGAKLSGGKASHHGELSMPPSMGVDNLVAAAAKL